MHTAVAFLSVFCATASTQVPFDDEASLCLLQKVAAVKPVWHSVDLNPAPEHSMAIKASHLALAAVDSKPEVSEAIKAKWHSTDLNPAPEHVSYAKASALEKSLSDGREAAKEKIARKLSDEAETALEKMSLSSASETVSGATSSDVEIEDAAESAALSEDGYNAVAALGNRELMRSYVRRVAKDEGLRITNEGSLSGALAYYTGECSTQSYAALVRELWRGTETAKCKQSWVETVKASSLLQTSSHPHKSHSVASSITDQDEPDTTWRWAEDLEDSLGALQAELMNLKTAVLDDEEQQLKELESKEEESRQTIHESNHVEKKIPLNQEGYEQLAAKGNTTEMALFVRRVAEHDGFKITNVKPLQGMSRYYSGECATQSFQALKNELQRVAGRSNSRCGGGPWLVKQ